MYYKPIPSSARSSCTRIAHIYTYMSQVSPPPSSEHRPWAYNMSFTVIMELTSCTACVRLIEVTNGTTIAHTTDTIRTEMQFVPGLQCKWLSKMKPYYCIAPNFHESASNSFSRNESGIGTCECNVRTIPMPCSAAHLPISAFCSAVNFTYDALLLLQGHCSCDRDSRASIFPP